MKSKYSRLSDQTLLQTLADLLAQDRGTTVELLACLAEVDSRKLYLPDGYPSMYAYCVEELHLCEQAAYKRILAARTARRFPAIFGAVAQGRLHLSAVCLLAPHLTEGTANELLTAATHRTKAEIERLLAERFPRPDMLAWVQLMSRPCPTSSVEPSVHVNGQLSPGIVDAPPAAAESGDRSRVKPLTPQRFQVQFTMSGEAHDLLRYAQALLGHQVPSGDIGQIFERAMKLLVPHLERTKFAAAQKPRRGQLRSSANPRHVPAHVKRTVWERDGGQCTFVSDGGRRCPRTRG